MPMNEMINQKTECYKLEQTSAYIDIIITVNCMNACCMKSERQFSFIRLFCFTSISVQ